MAHFFIDRPIFAWVIAIVIMLGGSLSISQLPLEVEPSAMSLPKLGTSSPLRRWEKARVAANWRTKRKPCAR